MKEEELAHFKAAVHLSASNLVRELNTLGYLFQSSNLPPGLAHEDIQLIYSALHVIQGKVEELQPIEDKE